MVKHLDRGLYYEAGLVASWVNFRLNSGFSVSQSWLTSYQDVSPWWFILETNSAPEQVITYVDPNADNRQEQDGI